MKTIAKTFTFDIVSLPTSGLIGINLDFFTKNRGRKKAFKRSHGSMTEFYSLIKALKRPRNREIAAIIGLHFFPHASNLLISTDRWTSLKIPEMNYPAASLQ